MPQITGKCGGMRETGAAVIFLFYFLHSATEINDHLKQNIQFNIHTFNRIPVKKKKKKKKHFSILCFLVSTIFPPHHDTDQSQTSAAGSDYVFVCELSEYTLIPLSS